MQIKGYTSISVTAFLIFCSTILHAANERGSAEILADILFSQGESNEVTFLDSSNKEKAELIRQSLKAYNPRESILFTKDTVKKISISSAIRVPIIEFKKINPTKYRIRVHGAIEDFPLILNESYHDGWKMYITLYNATEAENYKLIDYYKTFEADKEAQASKEELTEFIRKNWISTLGDTGIKRTKYKIYDAKQGKYINYERVYYVDFISKKIGNSIQNDNLPDGHFWEVWNKKYIPDDFHWVASGYVNAWWISLNEIKKANNYIQIPDGSMNFEIILEFLPQRLFYLGLLISSITLLSLFAYLVYDLVKKKCAQY